MYMHFNFHDINAFLFSLVINIFFGLNLSASHVPVDHANLVMAAYAAVFVLVYLVLEIYNRFNKPSELNIAISLSIFHVFLVWMGKSIPRA